jgi:hypothetical protein
MSERQLHKTPLPEFEGEQEVDFGRYGRAIAARWWLVLLGLGIGVVIGLLLSLGTTRVYNAQAVAYLGSPLAPGGGAQVSSPPTQLALAAQTAIAESSIRQVAAEVGLRPGQLRGHVTARPIAGLTNTKTGTPAPILAITVTGRQPKRVVAAANALAQLVSARSSTYVETKIRALKDHLAYDGQQLDIVRARLVFARRQLQVALKSTSLGTAAQLISIQNFNSIIVSSESREGALEQDRFAVRQTLKLAQEIEAGKIVTRAAAVGTSARSRRNSVVVGGLIGLILGALVAILWEPAAGRFAGRPAA